MTIEQLEQLVAALREEVNFLKRMYEVHTNEIRVLKEGRNL
jgi:archaellum component FlaC